MILMIITSMMAVILVMTVHGCYLACKKRVDDALPIAKPVASRVPIIRPNTEAPRPVDECSLYRGNQLTDCVYGKLLGQVRTGLHLPAKLLYAKD